MVNEAVQNYVNLVSGLTKTTRAKAAAGAKALLAQAGLADVATDAGGRVSKLADEIVSASKANRQLMRNLVASEVEQVVSRLGFVRADELERLRAEVNTLQQTVTGLAPAGPTAPEDIPARNAAGKKAATAKTSAKKAATKKVAAKKATAKKTGPVKTTAPGDSGPSDG